MKTKARYKSSQSIRAIIISKRKDMFAIVVEFNRDNKSRGLRNRYFKILIKESNSGERSLRFNNRTRSTTSR